METRYAMSMSRGLGRGGVSGRTGRGLSSWNLMCRAGKGFGKPKPKAPEEKAASDPPKPVSLGTKPPPPPSFGGGDGSWASEVREQRAYESTSGEAPGDPATPKGPARIPAEQYKMIDENFVQALAFLFVGIFVEGLLVAGSGFLPDDVDNFIVTTVFPAFTPTLGVFLLISVLYGLFKTKIEPE